MDSPIDVVALLRELEFTITEGTSSTSWLLRAPNGTTFEITPAPATDRLNARHVRNHHRLGTQLLVGSSATPGVIQQALAGSVNILTEEPLRLIHAGTTYTAGDEPETPHPRPRPSTRPTWMRWATARFLLLTHAPARQSKIAASLGTSQQSVSNAAKSLESFVANVGHGLEAVHRSALLEHWLNEYTGPGGQEFGWYSLDPAGEQVSRAHEVAKLLDVDPLVSGDVAADQLAPWKLPAQGRIYVAGPIDLSGDGFVPAPVDEATLVTCIPQDPTLWRLVDQFPEAGELTLADPAIVYWDLATSEAMDSREAADHLAGRRIMEEPA